MPRKPKIVERKLGRERAYGQAWQGEDLAEIDPRQSERERLDTILHELIHLADSDATEAYVARLSRYLSGGLWDHGYRRVRLE